MATLLIIADDLTGANATGVQLTARGFSARTVLADLTIEQMERCVEDALIKPVPSRAKSASEAYRLVYDTVHTIRHAPVTLYSKRIDSTLRGNVGAETDAFLDALGDDRLAVVVPAFPSAGRIVAGGYLLVNGVALDKTSAADDPTSGIDSADTARIFARQSSRTIASIFINGLRLDEAALADRFRSIYAEGARIVICDAIDACDLDHLARAVVDSDIPAIAVDPGAFSAALATQLLGAPAHNLTNLRTHGAHDAYSTRVLIVIGSVNAVAATQVEALKRALTPATVVVDTRALLNDSTRRAEIARVVQQSSQAKTSFVLIAGDGLDPSKRLDLAAFDREGCDPALAAARINDAFAEIGRTVLNTDTSINGLLTSGGDITLAVYEQLAVEALVLESEVVPLGSFGHLRGGPFENLPVITKGGMVGAPDALVTCAKHLLHQPPYKSESKKENL